jgi:limonene-1,2-epoxide hydrolase
MVRRGPLVVVLALLIATATGCGDHQRRVPASVQPVDESAPPPVQQGNGIDPAVLAPKRVPRHGTGAADPRAVRVIRRWLAALRAGDIPRAAHYFAIPSRFQNGTPVLTLDSRTEVLAVNVSFPCGAVATRFRSAGAFTLVRFRLTERTNGDCRGAAGHTTGGAIRVAGGRIHEWYRLYDADEKKPGPAAIDPGNEEL